MNGLFAEHGLDVEVLDPSGGPDNVVRVGQGGPDFALTSVQHYLTARDSHGEVGARFVAMIVQRSPVGALVPVSSGRSRPEDLAGCRLGADPANPQVSELLATLAYRGIAAPVVVEMDGAEARAALGRGEVDAIVALVDALPRRRRQAGVDLRAVRVGRDDVYGSGLVAADSASDTLVRQVRAAVAAALEAQRRQPDAGLDAMSERYTDDLREDAPESWDILEDLVFTGVPVGTMDEAQWRTTLEFLCAARDLTVPEPSSVYRPELVGAPVPG